MLSALAGLVLAVRIAYSPPVNDEIVLAGNFGEPRPDHFHCGIDIKTGGVEGKPIYAMADGYVSRITVGLSGFGNALYITHPDGRTTVYCHLKAFAPRIEAFLRKWQYANESYVADVRLAPLDCPVAQRQLVAVSGNTGASQAPHLHLEIHDADTGSVIDPLDVVGVWVSDGMAPIAHAFMVYPVHGEGVFEGSSRKRSFRLPSHRLSRRFTAWGKVGFGIWANDYMECAYNKYGVREISLKVDGQEVFGCCVDTIPAHVNRQINFWCDYDHYAACGVWYEKSFLTPGNRLPFIRTDGNGGIVDFSEARDYSIEYELKDYFGNTSVYGFTVRGDSSAIPQAPEPVEGPMMYCNRVSTYSQPGVWLVIPPGALDGDTRLSPRALSKSEADAVSRSYSFSRRPLPLSAWAELAIAVETGVANPDKLYVESSAGRYCGGEYKNGWVVTRVRDLGVAYTLAYDDMPPTLSPIGVGSWTDSRVVSIRMDDEGSGVASFKGYVDGQFVLFEPKGKGAVVTCRLADTPLRRTGTERHLKFMATDKRGNVSVLECDFVY